MTPFPTVFDSSILSAAKSCHHKFFREYVEHYKPRTLSVHLHAGAAFASGVEAVRTAFYVEGKPADEALALGLQRLMVHYGAFECPPDSAKSCERMLGALEFYFSHYPLGEDGLVPITLPGGRLGIEISFAEPLPIAHPETGDPIIFCGRLDAAAHYSGGVFGVDEKTTSSLGATWSRQWDLRGQFTGYTWGMKRSANITLNGFLVRGIAILKTKYDTQPAITYRPEWLVDEWFASTCDTIESLILAWKKSYWRKAFDHACDDYGGCAFRAVCQAREPQGWLDTNFQRRVWNPLARTETVL